jgi:hypothetical protein
LSVAARAESASRTFCNVSAKSFAAATIARIVFSGSGVKSRLQPAMMTKRPIQQALNTAFFTIVS